MSGPTVVVGAGLAGLTAAGKLVEAGREVIVLEASDRPGGQIKTDRLDGFRLDRGFQVYFDSYPHAKQVLDHRALELRPFVPGATLWTGTELKTVNRDDPFGTLAANVFPFGDLAATAELSLRAHMMSLDDVWADIDRSSGELFNANGFSAAFTQLFAQPFFGGIFLDRSLKTSARMMLFIWKMLLSGSACIPAKGMEEIPKQLAAALPDGMVRTRAKVQELIVSEGRITGVRLEDGETLACGSAVLAATPHESARLLGREWTLPSFASTVVYFDSPEPLTREAILVLNSLGEGSVNHVVDLTAASPDYAPAGRRLISATVLGAPEGDDAFLSRSVRYELQRWFPRKAVSVWRPLAVVRVPHAQYEQQPGFMAQTLPAETGIQGVVGAGEAFSICSIDGACRTGLAAARAIIEG
jgi:phytoene dehydrogenase-like protein